MAYPDKSVRKVMSINKIKILRNRFFYLWMMITAIIIFITVSFMVNHWVFPIQKEILLKAEKEKLQEMSMMIINRLDYYNQQVLTGKSSLIKAQNQARLEIEFLNQKTNEQNYFWIYNINSSLTTNQLNIQKFNQIIKSKGFGFLNYNQNTEDKTNFENQENYFVINFQPWEWVIGRGLDYQGFNTTLKQENEKLIKILGMILLVLVIPIALMAWILKLRDWSMIAEIKLQTNELKRLAMIAEHTHSGILIMNKDGEIEWLNKSFTNITGYTLPEVLGKKPADFLNGENTDPNVILEMRQGLKNRKRVCVELCNYKKNGDQVWLNIEVIPILDSKQEVINHIAIEQDITSRMSVEKEKSEMRKKLIHSDKLATIGELAAGVGHEINNPLTIVQGNLEMLGREYAKDDAFNIRFEKINSAMERIRGIVKGLRSFARNDSEEQEIMDVHEAINDTVSLVESIFEKENIVIKKNFGCNNSKVIINLGRFQQVLMNLLTNSKDALEGVGGQIDIITKNINNQVCIKIIDNGCGIKEEDLGKIFQAFHTTKDVGKGTGLGLSIVSSIIDSFEGSISVKSKVNVGTEFEVLLPLADCVLEIHKKQEKVKEKSTSTYRGKILVVDDEEDIREILKSYLEDVGFVVDEAADGQIALEMVKEEKYIMVFVDLKMPNMRGDEFINNVRNKLCDNIPIIVVTGCQLNEEKSKTSDIVNRLSSGIIYKPFNREEIYKMISNTAAKIYTKAS